MQIEYEKQTMPKVFVRNGMECYLDPIREKLIQITPEETVRQQIISYLLNKMSISKELIQVEQHLSHYQVSSVRRADIVIEQVLGDVIAPLAIIECKAPCVAVDEKAVNQVLDYACLLYADYVMVTNGQDEVVMKYDEVQDRYIEIQELPSYVEMLHGKGEVLPPPQPFVRVPFEQLKQKCLDDIEESKKTGVPFFDISVHTPVEKAVVAYNFMETLYDVDSKMPTGNYGAFTLIEDYGVRKLSYGNAAGGTYSGLYRSFLIDVNGSTEFVSLSLVAYNTTDTPLKTNTCIAVAIDNEKTSHHALQHSIEECVILNGMKCEFIHSGRIAIGHKGSGKIAELRELVKIDAPELIKGDKFYLGSLVNDRLWKMSDPDFVELLANFIKYALIRDKYRKIKSQM